MAAGQDQILPPGAVKMALTAVALPGRAGLTAWRRGASSLAAGRAAVPAAARASRESVGPSERAP
jgi:hypothetical protein